MPLALEMEEGVTSQGMWLQNLEKAKEQVLLQSLQMELGPASILQSSEHDFGFKSSRTVREYTGAIKFAVILLQLSPYVISSISLLIISKLLTLVLGPAWFGPCPPFSFHLQLFSALALISSCALLVLFCLRTFTHAAFYAWSTLPLQHSHPASYLSQLICELSRLLSLKQIPPLVISYLHCSPLQHLLQDMTILFFYFLIFFCLFDCSVGFMEAKTPDLFLLIAASPAQNTVQIYNSCCANIT